MIRAVAEFHSLSPKQEPPSDINAAALQRTASLGGAFLSKASNLKRSATYGQPSSRKLDRPQLGKQVTTPAGEELHNVKDALNTVDEYHATVVETLEVTFLLPVLPVITLKCSKFYSVTQCDTV